MYFSKEVVRGYNSYIDRAKDDMGTMMDVGLLVMEKGDVYEIDEKERRALFSFSQVMSSSSMREKRSRVTGQTVFAMRHTAFFLHGV